MRWISDVTPVGRLPRSGSTIGIVSLCVGLLAGFAAAQSQPPSTKNKADAESKAPSSLAAEIQSRARAEALAKQKIKDAARKKAPRAAKSFEPDPNAKWACDKPTVEVEPVWRGNKSLTFAFDIKNNGTADLKYRPRGG